MQKLGQHFLKNQDVIRAIVAAVDIRASDFVVEIGPGHGELTTPLAETCARFGVQLCAIEKDATLVATLKEKFKDWQDVIVADGDVRDILPEIIKSGSREGIRFKLVGNLPYYLTGHLLRMISELAILPERCVFMVQREVAERMTAQPPAMNRLAASVQIWGDAKTVIKIPRGDFLPPPKVESAVVVIETKTANPAVSAERYYAAVHALFAQPRKTILNNVKAWQKNMVDRNAKSSDAVATLSKIGIQSGDRPQNLSIEQIVELAKELF